MKYRLLNKIYANLLGFFWEPCPICGQHFGGHEWKDDCLMRNHTESEGVCPDCGEKAREMNKEWLKKNPYPPVKLPQWEVDMINRNKSGMKLAEFKKALEWNDFAIGDTFWLDDIKFEVKDKRRIGFK